MNEPLLQIRGLGKDFPVKNKGWLGSSDRLVAVDQIDLILAKGTCLGLVGESGCGKTTLGRLLCRLETPSRGAIYFNGQPIHHLRGRALRNLRTQFQPVFQDPLGSLNPRFSVAETLREALIKKRSSADSQALKVLLNRVGLDTEVLGRYPHQLSGGQRQRIGIARALALEPILLVADEPVSSLDVSIQAQILNLLLALQRESGLSMIFISHDLRVVSHLADEVGVMYLGRMMELAPVRSLFDKPRHPYTQALLKALPRLKPGRGRKRAVLMGDLPSPVNPRPGCRFYSRCPFGDQRCLDYENDLLMAGEHHQVACIKWKELSI